MIKQIFNYYVVLKSCWIILLFQVIGFVSLVVMEQGKDILQSLSFNAEGLVYFHTWFSLFAVTWWSWQSWRAARVVLHFTTFDFVQFHRNHALQAQVLIPRILGVVPLLIFTYGILLVTSWSNPLVYVSLSLVVWLYVFFHFRKDLVVLFLSRNKWKILNIPAYVHVKNEGYPAQFIWEKQGKWVFFRLFMILSFFVMVTLSPVRFPQFLGASAVILYALGGWLVVATIIDFAERRFRFPFTFTLIAMVIGFSFFNNNHAIRQGDRMTEDRLQVAAHFDRWYASRGGEDTIPVYLVACQGGGVRSAYWSAQVLGELQRDVPAFDRYTYAYSSVSGGSLGVATYKQLLHSGTADITNDAHNILSKDFLAPVTSWLVVPDLVQKFIPFPIHQLDRAKALEYSWENAANLHGKSLLHDGFLKSFENDECVYLFNSTRVENGFRTLISNVQISPDIFTMTEDFFDVTRRDIPLSTAVSLSSRFPFITPPGQVLDTNNQVWGNLVDGGYIENMGATAMLELYDYLQKYSVSKGYKVAFKLLFIKNTKVEYSTKISGLTEILAPLNTFSKVWVNSGYYDENNVKLNSMSTSDKAYFINLERDDEQIIPLGWYLSSKATQSMQDQVKPQTRAFKDVMLQEPALRFLD